MLATYPLRNEDGTLARRKSGGSTNGGATKTGVDQYPATLPIFRPWLDEKTFQ